MSDYTQLEQELKELKQRFQVLEDKEAIRDLLVQYSFNADLDRTDAFVDLWTEDGVFDVGQETPVFAYQTADMVGHGQKHHEVCDMVDSLAGVVPGDDVV